MATHQTKTLSDVPHPGDLALSIALAAVIRNLKREKAAILLDAIDDAADRWRREAVGRSNVFPLGAKRQGWGPRAMSALDEATREAADLLEARTDALRKEHRLLRGLGHV